MYGCSYLIVPNKDSHFQFNGKISQSRGWYGYFWGLGRNDEQVYSPVPETESNYKCHQYLLPLLKTKVGNFVLVEYLNKTLVMGWPPGPRTQCHPDHQDEDLHFLFIPENLGIPSLTSTHNLQSQTPRAQFPPWQVLLPLEAPHAAFQRSETEHRIFHLGDECTVILCNFVNIHHSLIPRMSSQNISWLWWFDAWLGISKMFSGVCSNWSHVKCRLCTSGMLRYAGHIWGPTNI